MSISSVTVAELYVWVFRNPTRTEVRRSKLVEMLREMKIYDFSGDMAEMYGQIQAALMQRGVPAPPTDLLIASTALVHDLTLVTHNVADFANIPDLRVEDWIGT